MFSNCSRIGHIYLRAECFDTSAEIDVEVYPTKYVDFSPDKLSLEICIACFSL